MRAITILFILFITTVNAQETESIEKLKSIKSKINKDISILNDSIKKIDLLILSLETKIIRQQINDSSLKAVCKSEAKLKANPHVLSPITSTLKKGTEILIIDYVDGFFGVCCDTVCGYMNEVWIESNEQINKFIELKKKEKEEFENSVAQKKEILAEKEKAEREKRYLKKYGQATYNKLKQGMYWIGMNEDMAIISLGYPDKINRTVNKYGVHEQWVYNGLYLYFDNGILTTFQD